MTTDFWITSTRAKREPEAPDDRIYVRQYGMGRAVLIAVHGFGRSGARMQGLGMHLGDRFTTLAPDLPYHGKTEWYSDRYTVEDFTGILQQLLDRYSDRPVYLMGHSLGGRFLSSCLGSLEHSDLRDLALVAPDGAGGRYTNWIDTLPSSLVRPLALISERPRAILRLSNWLRKRGILNRYSAEYLKYNLNDGSFRRRLAGTLRSVLKFPPRPETFEASLRKKNIHCTVFVGDKDPLLHHDRLSGMYEPLPSVSLHHYNGSHWLPEQLLAGYYRKYLSAALP